MAGPVIVAVGLREVALTFKCAVTVADTSSEEAGIGDPTRRSGPCLNLAWREAMYALRGKDSTQRPSGCCTSRLRPLPLAVVVLALFALCCLFGAVASAGAAAPTPGEGAGLGRPTVTAPSGNIAPLRPTFKWSKVSGAATYELRVYKGSRLLLKKTGVIELSWKSSKALPMNVGLTWKVRATGAGGSGPWSDSLGFQIGAAGTTNYAAPAHWLFVPKKPRMKVDVFYLYPTAYTKADPSAPIIGPIDDPGMMRGAGVALQRQAWAFRTFANIYAPYYRQADAASRAALPQKEQVKIVAGAPTQDGIAAFDYYIRHCNHGRPFILAGHSLGSNVMANLLAQYMRARPGVYKRMVAAYVVGYSITPHYLTQNPFLKFAKGPNDTGVIASWNTEAPTIAGPNPVILPGGLVINPITWTRTETLATARQNRGSIMLDTTTGGTPMLNTQGRILRVMNLADAQIDKAKGVLICSTVNAANPPYFTPGGLPMGVFHVFDYPLYFFDVRANAADRVEHFFAKHGGVQ